MANVYPGGVGWLISLINKNNFQSTWKIEKYGQYTTSLSEAVQKMNIEEEGKS